MTHAFDGVEFDKGAFDTGEDTGAGWPVLAEDTKTILAEDTQHIEAE